MMAGLPWLSKPAHIIYVNLMLFNLIIANIIIVVSINDESVFLSMMIIMDGYHDNLMMRHKK